MKNDLLTKKANNASLRLLCRGLRQSSIRLHFATWAPLGFQLLSLQHPWKCLSFQDFCFKNEEHLHYICPCHVVLIWRKKIPRLDLFKAFLPLILQNLTLKSCNCQLLQVIKLLIVVIFLHLPPASGHYNVSICLQTTATETSAPELAKLLYWLMVVGYSIRNIEVRFDMERVLGTTAKVAELPPGENIQSLDRTKCPQKRRQTIAQTGFFQWPASPDS